MATLLDAVSANGAGTGAEHTDPTSVQSFGTFDGCDVIVEESQDGTNWSPIYRFERPGWIIIDLVGTYEVRGNVENAGSDTSVSLVTTD